MSGRKRAASKGRIQTFTGETRKATSSTNPPITEKAQWVGRLITSGRVQKVARMRGRTFKLFKLAQTSANRTRHREWRRHRLESAGGDTSMVTDHADEVHCWPNLVCGVRDITLPTVPRTKKQSPTCHSTCALDFASLFPFLWRLLGQRYSQRSTRLENGIERPTLIAGGLFAFDPHVLAVFLISSN